MMEISIHIDLPALDRLVNYLEERAKSGEPLPLMEKRETPQLSKTKPEPEPKPEPKPETKPEPEPEPEPKPEPEPLPETAYTLDQVQRAAAQLRDQGKLKAVTDMFPEFGIRKLSDLKDEKLQDFAGRLIRLGAKL